MAERKEKLNLRRALNRSPKAGYLSFEICENLLKNIDLEKQIRCYGVVKQGGVPSGSGVVASDIFEDKDDKLVLFSIKSLVQNDYFTCDTEELLIKVDGREAFRKRVDFCPSMFIG